MSYFTATEPVCRERQGDVEVVIRPKEKDLGGFGVRRVLPSASRRAVGPFVFFDHMGPAVFPPGEGIQVRPHPHIGLATVTYLFEGEIMHRDSLGYAQPIRPGAVNLMTAGRGIVHSERAGEDLDRVSRLNGIQTWMALPEDQQEVEPDFSHYPADTLPSLDVDGIRTTVIMGSAYGHTSPVRQHSPTLYLELRAPAGSARVMVIGGEPLGRRRMWWNFVSTSMDRIEQAKVDWREGRFAPVPGDGEFIPLPDG